MRMVETAEIIYEWRASPPVPVPPEPSVPAATQDRPIIVVSSRRKPRRTEPATSEPSALVNRAPAAPDAAALLDQLPGIAAEMTTTPSSGARVLDLSVPEVAVSGAAIAPNRTQASIGGAPTRGDRAPVGDLANGLLIEQWHSRHHGVQSTNCDRQPEGEPLSSFLARCRQGL